jgi:hypothetical protein
LETDNATIGIFYHEEFIEKFVNAMLTVYYRESSLARINFIKSRLVYESFSDLSKDVDLVSQEILLLDTRFAHCPANKETQLPSFLLFGYNHIRILLFISMRIHAGPDPDPDQT